MFGSILKTSFVASAAVAVVFASGALAQPSKSYPDFSSSNFGWVTMRGGVAAMPGASAVGQDPYALVPISGHSRLLLPLANLTPFARDGLKKANGLADWDSPCIRADRAAGRLEFPSLSTLLCSRFSSYRRRGK